VGRVDDHPPLVTAALAAALAAAVALWSTSAHVVPTTAGLWRGLTDPPGALRLACAVALGIGAALFLGRRPPAVRRPLLVMGLAVAPLLPVLSGRGVALLAFQGPVLGLLAAAALSSAVVAAWSLRAWRPPRAAVLFAAAFLFYAVVGTRIPGPAGPQGDEPHYLTLTQSLLADGDLDLANQFADRDYRTFFAGRLEPHTSPASPAGRLYSVHTPGLAVLMLPAYALGGYPGARLLLSALAALTALLVHRLVHDVLGSPALALATWAVFTFTPPLPFYAVALYPETVAGLATAVFLLTSRRDPGWRAALAAGACAAALPWLHPKLLPLALAGLGLTLVRRCSWPLRLAGAAALVASVAGLLLFFHSHYGRVSLSAAYGTGFAADVSVTRIPWGLPALFFDRQFGLLSVAPLFALAVPGLVLLLRSRTGDGLRALLLGGASLLVGASFSMWWGGACPPARFVIPALPALALCLAPALRARPRVAAALAGLGVGLVALAADAPRALHNRADGESGLLRLLVPALDLDGALPSFALGGLAAPLLALTLAAAIALAWKRGRQGAVLGGLAYCFVAAGLREHPLLEERRAALQLLQAWDETNVAGVSGPLDLRTLSVPVDLRGAPWSVGAYEIRNSDRFDLPPGAYRVEVAGRTLDLPRGSRSTRLELASGDLVLERGFLEGQRGVSFPMLLPAGARRMVFTAIGVQGRGVIESVGIAPEAVVRRSRRDVLPWPRRPDEATYRIGSGEILTTVLDRTIHDASGFHLEGAEGVFLVEAPPGAEVAVRITRPRPAPGDALVWGERRFPLAATPTIDVRLPASDGMRLGATAVIPVVVHADGATVAFGR
jgi:hypothetical protein